MPGHRRQAWYAAVPSDQHRLTAGIRLQKGSLPSTKTPTAASLGPARAEWSAAGSAECALRLFRERLVRLPLASEAQTVITQPKRVDAAERSIRSRQAVILRQIVAAY
jgi:hypothetical protein